MRGPVMHAAERHREFIARLAAQRAWLHVAQMMGVGWFAAADKAWLLDDIAKVVAAAIAPRGSEREEALIDPLCQTSVGSFGNVLLRPNPRQIAGRGTPDQEAARLFAYGDPAGFTELIDKLVAASASYLVRHRSRIVREGSHIG